MKSILTLLGGTALAFTIGLVVTYLALPLVAPDLAERGREGSRLFTTAAPPEDTGNRLMEQPEDSLALLIAEQEALIETLRDSLATAMNRLHAAEAMEMSLAGQLEQLRQRERAAAARRMEAAQLASSLARLDVRERRDLIGQLDPDVLQKIYIEASPRSRMLLLEAMEPEGAAGLVGLLIQPIESAAGR